MVVYPSVKSGPVGNAAAAHSQVDDAADQRFANASIEVHVGAAAESRDSNSTEKAEVYKLERSRPLTVPNRRIGWIARVDGNQAQCQPVYSPNDYEQGQFPISVVDGATSTRWQSSSSNVSAVTVTLAGVTEPIVGFHFDWAQSPPVNATVVFHDEFIIDPAGAAAQDVNSYRVVTTLENIQLSKPYRPETTDSDQVAIPEGNTTGIRLEEAVPPAQFATLLITGNQGLNEGEDDVGATVAEWAILGETQGLEQRQRRDSRLRTAGVLDRGFLRRVK